MASKDVYLQCLTLIRILVLAICYMVREELYIKNVTGYNSCFTYILRAFLCKDDIKLLALCLEKL